jgi:ferredoxin
MSSQLLPDSQRTPRAEPPFRLPHPALLASTGAFALLAWGIAGSLWLRGERAFAVSTFALGLSLGPCLAGYLSAPVGLKQLQRRVVLAAGGISILAPALLGRVDLDLEGFFMLLFTGTMGVAVGHTAATVLVGPLAFGRAVCGWACWRSMVLELLPFQTSPGRRRGAWSLLPLVGLAASAGAAAFSVFALGLKPGGTLALLHAESVLPIAVVCAVYLVAAVGMALALRDARAFCKYLCPSGAILRWTSRTSLARMAARLDECSACGACSRACPMDVDVASFVGEGRRVASGDCILCQRCAHACPTGALRLTFTRGAAAVTSSLSEQSGQRRAPLSPARGLAHTGTRP